MLPPEDCHWQDWHLSLQAGRDHTLQEVLENISNVGANSEDIPLIIQLIENPKFRVPGVRLFNGAVDLHDHDCIHALLGRGLLSKDEAFVIGFTMGSTNRVTAAESKLYAFAAKHLYPGPYRFDDEDIEVFKDAVHLGYISDCIPLNEIDYKEYYGLSLAQIRAEIGLETDLLLAYYGIEKRRYPGSKASNRLL